MIDKTNILPEGIRLIGSQLKKRYPSGKIKEAAPGDYEQYAQNYTDQRIAELGLTDQDNTLTIHLGDQKAEHKIISSGITNLETKSGTRATYSTKIIYTNHLGEVMTWLKRKVEAPFFRLRIPTGLEYGGAKYRSEKGSGNRPFLTGLAKFFPDGKHLRIYITEGEFKALALCKAGVPAIGIAGISCGTRKGLNGQAYLLPEIKEALACYGAKEVVLLHDTDARDNIGKTERGRSFYGSIRNMFWALKQERINLVYKAQATEDKGVDDLLANPDVSTEDVVRALEINRQSRFFHSFEIKHSQKLDLIRIFLRCSFHNPDRAVLRNDRVTDASFYLYSKIKDKKKVAVVSGTGTGKTYWVLNDLAQRHEGQIVLFQPLKSIIKGIQSGYTGKDFAIITGGSEEMDYRAAAASKVVICTPDSYPKVKPYLDKKGLMYVVDEAHYMPENSDWKKVAGYPIAFNDAIHAEYSVFISATMPKHLEKLGFTYVELEAKNRQQLHFYPTEYKGKIQHYIKTRLEQSDLSKGKIVVWLNRKEDSVEQMLECIDNKKIRRDQVAIIRSDGGDAEIREELLRTHYIPDHIKVVITTKYLDCGVDIYNDDIQYVIMADDGERGVMSRASVSETIQFPARFRNMASMDVHVFKQQTSNFHKGITKRLEDIRMSTEKIAALANGMAEEYKSLGLPFNDAGEAVFKEEGIYKPNFLNMLYLLHKDEMEEMSNQAFWYDLENRQGVKVHPARELDINNDIKLQESEKALKATKKDRKKAFVKMLVEKPEEVMKVAFYITGKHELKKNIAEKYLMPKGEPPAATQELYMANKTTFQKDFNQYIKRYLFLKEESLATDKDTILMDNGSWGKFKKELKINKALANKDRLSPTDSIDIKRIEQHRETLNKHTDKWHTASQIAELVNQNQPKGFEYGVRKALSFVRSLTELEEHRSEDGKVRLYKVKGCFLTELTISINNTLDGSSVRPEIEAPEWNTKFEPAPF